MKLTDVNAMVLQDDEEKHPRPLCHHCEAHSAQSPAATRGGAALYTSKTRQAATTGTLQTSIFASI